MNIFPAQLPVLYAIDFPYSDIDPILSLTRLQSDIYKVHPIPWFGVLH